MNIKSLTLFQMKTPKQYHQSTNFPASNCQILCQSMMTNSQASSKISELYQRSQESQLSLDKKFKNLENPLRFIHSQKIQNLINDTRLTSKSLHEQMDEISQFSRHTYKQLISHQKSDFDFSQLHDQKVRDVCRSMQEQIESKMKQRSKRGQRQKKFKSSINKQTFLSFYQNPEQIKFRNLKKQTTNINKKQPKNQIPLNYDHIKLLQSQRFDQQCKNVQFYSIFRPKTEQIQKKFGHDYCLTKSADIRLVMTNLKTPFIQKSYYYGVKSQDVLINFQHLIFWNNIQNSKKTTSISKTEVQIMSIFQMMELKQISTNRIYDFGMGKFKFNDIKAHLNKQKQQKKIMRQDQNEDNLKEKCTELQKQYQITKEKFKKESTKTHLKKKNAQIQTTEQLEIQPYDEYFSEDTHLIIKKLIKLNDLRQKALKKSKKHHELIFIKNVCIEIKEMLFKLLLTCLKGETFYQQNNNKFPYFNLTEIFYAKSKDQVQKTILKLIYENFHQFKVNSADQIPKIDIIHIYIQERQKNSRILQILGRK